MIYHPAKSRGYAHHGWLESFHTFSFADYYDPNRMAFGALRVLNDDRIAAKSGFGTHPHRDMEIVTIPLKGELRHKDSMGHSEILKKGEVQAMSAGTGILHSEKNESSEPLELLQIWVLPEKEGIKPRYEQKAFAPEDRRQKFQTVVSPEGEGLWINQQAYFSLADMEKIALDYKIRRPGNGAYLFVISGSVQVAGKTLGERDGLGLEENFTVKTDGKAEVLVIDIPLQ